MYRQVKAGWQRPAGGPDGAGGGRFRCRWDHQRAITSGRCGGFARGGQRRGMWATMGRHRRRHRVLRLMRIPAREDDLPHLSTADKRPGRTPRKPTREATPSACSPDTDGYQRLSCPALGGHPKLMCPLRKASLSPRDGRPKVLQPPEEPPKICGQTAITVAPECTAYTACVDDGHSSG
jgi:hypothetical protein